MDAYVAKPLQPRELRGRDRERRRRRRAGAPPAAAASARAAGVVDLPRLLERVGGDRKALAAARPALPGRLAEAARADPRGRPGERRARRCAPPPTRSRDRCRTSPPRPPRRRPLRLQRMGETGDLAGAEGALDRLEREIGRVLEALAEAAPGPPRKAPRPRRSPARTPPGRAPGTRSRRTSHRPATMPSAKRPSSPPARPRAPSASQRRPLDGGTARRGENACKRTEVKPSGSQALASYDDGTKESGSRPRLVGRGVLQAWKDVRRLRGPPGSGRFGEVA